MCICCLSGCQWLWFRTCCLRIFYPSVHSLWRRNFSKLDPCARVNCFLYHKARLFISSHAYAVTLLLQDSKAQVTALHLIIGTLQKMHVFGVENRDTLTHKATGVLSTKSWHYVVYILHVLECWILHLNLLVLLTCSLANHMHWTFNNLRTHQRLRYLSGCQGLEK